MAELFSNLGFTCNPFSKFSAEEEKEYLDKIYIKPKYYETVYGDIKAGASRFIIGERGIGKTALMMKLEGDFKQDGVFTVIIDEYDGIKEKDNQAELLALIIRKVVTKYAVFLNNNKKEIKKLSKKEKEYLSFFVTNFFETLSESDYEKLAESVDVNRKANLFKWFFNKFLLTPINVALSGVSEWVSTTIAKSLGLPPVTEDFYKSYISELSIEDKNVKQDMSNVDYSTLKRWMKDLVDCMTKAGYKSIAIFLDRIDEYQQLGTNVKVISNFVKGLATDTSLLQMDKCSFVFVIWSKVKDELNTSGARFDKFKTIDINWSNDELIKIVNRRLNYFSDNKITLEGLFEGGDISNVIETVNKSPRQVIQLLSRIYDEQQATDDGVSFFSKSVKESGIKTYVSNYDFPSMYPGESGKKSYIVSVVNTLLKVGKIRFRTQDLVAAKKYSSQAANSDIRLMRDYALIEEDRRVPGPAKEYVVTHPTIRYMIEKNIDEMALPE